MGGLDSHRDYPMGHAARLKSTESLFGLTCIPSNMHKPISQRVGNGFDGELQQFEVAASWVKYPVPVRSRCQTGTYGRTRAANLG